MAHHDSVVVEGTPLGDFIDDGDIDALEFQTPAPRRSEIILPAAVSDFFDDADLAASSSPLTTFVVLFQNGERARVRGHGLKFLPNPTNPTEPAAYGVVRYEAGKEVFVALCRSDAVNGIIEVGVEAKAGVPAMPSSVPA